MPAKPNTNPKPRLDAAGSVWLSRDGKSLLDGGRFDLLAKIAETGSITKAGKAVGISYRTAWLAVDRLNALSDLPLVERSAGGKRGGGTRLTAEGLRLLEVYRALQEEHGRYLGRLKEGVGDFDRFLSLARKLTLRTSVRNQFFGKVERIVPDGLETGMVLRLKGNERIVSRITTEGLEELGIRVGEEAYALVKANWVGLEAPSPARKAAGENRFDGTVESFRTLKDKAEVVVRLPSGLGMVAMVPGKVLEELGLREGKAVRIFIHPSNVILGTAR
jgi:molybdate transport system regulatory protein